jgi:hypothetical protein
MPWIAKKRELKLETTIKIIIDGIVSAVIGGLGSIPFAGGAIGGYVVLQPVSVAWDRLNYTFTGDAEVVVDVKVIDSQGNVIAEDSATEIIEITASDLLRINDINWDSESQEFVTNMSCKYEIAVGGDHKVNLWLELSAPGVTEKLTGSHGVQILEGAEKDEEGFIAIEPLEIEWADGSSFTGSVEVTGTASLLNPSGSTIDQNVFTKTIDITEPCGDECPED